MVLLKVNRVGNNANRVRMRLAKITRRCVGRQWKSGIEILMEMMEEDFSFVWLETLFSSQSYYQEATSICLCCLIVGPIYIGMRY